MQKPGPNPSPSPSLSPTLNSQNQQRDGIPNPGLLPSLLIASLVTFLFGAALSRYFPQVSLVAGGLWMLAAAGTGWVLTATLALRQAVGKRAEYWLELGRIMTVGVMILLPVSGLLLGGLALHWAFPLLSVMLSSGTMFLMHRHGTRKLGLNSSWNAIWFGSLQLTALIVTLSWAHFYAFL